MKDHLIKELNSELKDYKYDTSPTEEEEILI